MPPRPQEDYSSANSIQISNSAFLFLIPGALAHGQHQFCNQLLTCSISALPPLPISGRNEETRWILMPLTIAYSVLWSLLILLWLSVILWSWFQSFQLSLCGSSFICCVGYENLCKSNLFLKTNVYLLDFKSKVNSRLWSTESFF